MQRFPHSHRYQRLTLLVLIALLISPLNAIRFASAQAAPAKWTIMVYIAANNNLEENSIVNLMEMASVGSTKDVNIVTQITRPPDYSGIYGEWGGTRRFLITKSDGGLSAGDFQISPPRLAAYLEANADQVGLTPDKVKQITRGPVKDQEQTAQKIFVPIVEKDTSLTPIQVKSVQDLGDKVNSADGATLADFGTWAVQNYPAEHYGLIVWDHGGGWSMVASDDTLGEAGMKMPDLQKALDTITQATKQKFDFIGFDACLMSQLPVASTLKPYANYEIAAEELVPGLGWDYAPGLALLVSNPASTAQDFAKAAINGFDTAYSTTLKDQGGDDFDLGITDLSKLDPVVAALDKFTAAVKASGDEFKTIAKARANALAFASIGDSSDAADAFSSIDLADFMRLMGTLSQNADVKQASKEVIDAISGMVVYHKTSKLLANAKGLSIFFPSTADNFKNADGDRYRQEFGTLLPSWQEFLDSYYGVTSANVPTIKITSVTTNTGGPASVIDAPVITSSITGNNLVSLSADIFHKRQDGTLLQVDSFPIDTQITAEDGSQISLFADGESTNDFYWNTKLFSLTDGTTSAFAVATSTRKDAQHAYVAGLYTNSVTGKSGQASLLINLDTGLASGLWLKSGRTVAQIFAKPGDTFKPIYKKLDPTTNATNLLASSIALTFGKDPFALKAGASSDGTYIIVLSLEDAFGNIARVAASVEVKNSGVDTSKQGFKDIGLGISFLYPFRWTEVESFGRADGGTELSVSDPSGVAELTVDNYPDVTSLDALVEKVTPEIENDADQLLTEPTSITVGADNIPATKITYEYTDADGNKVYGIAVAVYAEQSNQGFLLKLESPSANAEGADKFMDGLLTTILFFPPAQ